MRILWISANKLGYELLLETQKLQNISIIGIVTLSEDSPTIMYDPIEKDNSWYDFGYPVFEVTHINEEDNLIKRMHADLVIMCGWRQIVNEEIFSVPEKGFIGFHPTLLPYGRGPAPIINSILYGLRESGITMFYVNKETDSGDIIGQENITIASNDYAIDVYNKIIQAGKILIKKCLPLVALDENVRIPQNEDRTFYFPKRTIQDNEIDLENDNLDTIYNKIRAFSYPYKGAFILQNDKKITIWKADVEQLK